MISAAINMDRAGRKMEHSNHTPINPRAPPTSTSLSLRLEKVLKAYFGWISDPEMEQAVFDRPWPIGDFRHLGQVVICAKRRFSTVGLFLKNY